MLHYEKKLYRNDRTTKKYTFLYMITIYKMSAVNIPWAIWCTAMFIKKTTNAIHSHHHNVPITVAKCTHDNIS